MPDENALSLIAMTAGITSAYLNKNPVSSRDLPAVIESIHGALERASQPEIVDEPPQEPAVSIRASIKPDYLICLEDGKKLRMLKRYLNTHYGMTPKEYREKWGLPHDYPMVAPSYASRRTQIAHEIGLGRKPNESTVEDVRPDDLKLIGAPRSDSAATATARFAEPSKGAIPKAPAGGA